MRYNYLAITLSFVLLGGALFLLPTGLRRRIAGLSQLFTAPGEAFAAMCLRTSREALGGLPPNMTLQQRDELLEQTARAKAEVASRNDQLSRLQAENRFLQRLMLHVKKNRDFTLTVCQVLQRPQTGDYNGTLLLDRGSTDGLRPGLAVLGLEGVVGVIESCTTRTATVRLLTAATFILPVTIESAQAGALLQSRNGQCYLTAATGKDYASLRVGQRVFTSALGQDAMQPGLLVGTIRAMEWHSDGSPQYEITPATNFQQLPEYLLVAFPIQH